MRGQILIVDDDRDMCETLKSALNRREFATQWRSSAEEAFTLVGDCDFDAVVTDLNMPGMDGAAFCQRITANRPDLPVLVITAFGSLDTAVAAIRAGAYDFLTKPFEIDELSLALDRAVQHRRLREEVRRLRQAVQEREELDELKGKSPAMRAVYRLIERTAVTEAAALITGETGTGKELTARALHRRSARRDGPFVAINCAAVPEPLLESELFGHGRGAFTDARAERKGLFLQAHGGTLFLDEVGSMPLTLQPKLLRALQERKVRAVGTDREHPFDARIVAATNTDLESAVAEGRFRNDLYFRLNVIQIELPPLRARGADVLLLAQHFVAFYAERMKRPVRGLSAPAADSLMNYAWPGNVRELQNAIERGVAITTYDLLMVEDLPEKIRSYRPSHIVLAADDPSELVTIEELERRYIARVLEAAGGNKTMAARILGLDRKTLYRKLDAYARRNA
jgi:two-component system response regulator AtoC